jgi:hypothetical protein
LEVAGHAGQGGTGLIAEATKAFGSGLDSAATTSAAVALFGVVASILIMPRRTKSAAPASATDGAPATQSAATGAPAESGVAAPLPE